MNAAVRKALPLVATLVLVVAALLVLRHLWQYYMRDPWTRDAHIAADVVQVAPDVSGLVAEVRVRDNAPVQRGEVLFVVDQERYHLALAQAQGVLAQSRAALARSQAALVQSQAEERQLQREASRDRALRDLVATEEIEARRASLEKAQAAVVAAQAGIATAKADIESAQAAVDLAQLNLERTVVRSPVDGRVSDRVAQVGDYVAAGKPVLAVLDTGSLRIDGYFEETRLHGVHEGDRVDIHLMGERGLLHGHVHSIAAGIEDRYRSDSSRLLPNVAPVFEWVRLAQRVPVQITIDEVPAGVRLIAGRSVTVSVVAGKPARAKVKAKAS
ncbi:HlyD family secretion protein [Immundisolibacter sp.]|jgi:multidrug resistance efflux pump|uniref:HlyD family efflux transporter periplasmic adaptor subunit n=1 Tax=Immundisolibacter sp. TaxID=1934948 RepID=UPI0019884E14|nr:HlyD family secretion protein [Immundisolibacter sp.]MBC7161290.1 HlyD family secretion protein [Immundisolibacter sp.]MEA3218947.1 p-hydroxybenzoic acid efflux pump subunit AaeA [Immundisolibacter sp.]